MAAGMVYAGRVVAVEPDGPRVVVPQLGGTGRFGPLPSAVPDLAVGETVIVTNLGISRDQLVVLGRMAGRVPEVDEIPGLAATLSAHDTRLDAVELDNDTDQQVLTDHTARIGAVETVNGQQDTRLAATEGVANGAASAANTLRTDTAGKVTNKGDLLIATAAGTLARQPVVPTGWMLSGDPNSATGWASRDVLGLPRNLAGANTPTRYVGGTVAGAPTTGTFAVGDFVVSQQLGDIWVCVTAGTPGTWVSGAAALRTELFGGPTRTKPYWCKVQFDGDYNYPGSADILTQGGWYAAETSDPNLWAVSTGSEPYSHFTIPATGRYRVTYDQYNAAPAAADHHANVRILRNIVTATDFQQTAIVSDTRRATTNAGESLHMRAETSPLLTAGDKIYFSQWANTTYTMRGVLYAAVRTHMTLRWVGAS